MFLQMTRNFGRASQFRPKGAQFFHQAPDYKFLKESINSRFDNQSFPNRNCYGKSVLATACEEMSAFPKLMHNALITSAAMATQDMIPFFHGEPPVWNAVRLFIDTLINSKKEKNYYKYFRLPTDIDQIERVELVQRIDQYISNNGPYHKNYKTLWGDPLLSPLDVNPGLRPHLLSVSYALTSNVSKYDSAYWFTFHYRKDVKKVEDVFAKAIANSMRMRGYSPELIAETINQINPLFQEYMKLKVGNLMVIGVPKEKVSEYVYDSKSMGHPTGKNIKDLIDDPFAEPTERIMGNDGGLQARLLLYKDTLTPKSGIKVIVANDDSEVKDFTDGLDIENPLESPVFDRLVGNKSTSIEDADKLHRKILDSKLIEIAENVRRRH